MHISHCVSSKRETVPKPANIRDSVPARPVDSRKEERTVEPLSYGYEMTCTVPLDVAMPGSRFQKLSSDFSQLTFMPMYVSAVCSPALFFVQVYGSSTADLLDDLMDDMDILYSDPEVSQQYSIPLSFLVPGFPCAAPYGIGTQSWHRTLLLRLLRTSAGDDASMERQACLYFVDYGDTCNVNVSSLRLLRLSFMELPAQAIPAQLSYLHPLGEQWSPEARDYLLKLTCERVLMALVVGHTEGSMGNKGPVKEQGVKLSICLSDTTGKDDVHINDELVKQGFAMQSRDAEEDLDPAHPYVMYLCKDDSVKTPAFKAEPSCIVDGGCETPTQVSKPKMEAEPGEITEPVLLNLERLLT
uniref:Tudor domain-containing protein n=1 Tax=Eptatretus burgeri TaxID=7764 RepID=A0A8C4NBL6_EPTBU